MIILSSYGYTDDTKCLLSFMFFICLLLSPFASIMLDCRTTWLLVFLSFSTRFICQCIFVSILVIICKFIATFLLRVVMLCVTSFIFCISFHIFVWFCVSFSPFRLFFVPVFHLFMCFVLVFSSFHLFFVLVCHFMGILSWVFIFWPSFGSVQSVAVTSLSLPLYQFYLASFFSHLFFSIFYCSLIPNVLTSVIFTPVSLFSYLNLICLILHLSAWNIYFYVLFYFSNWYLLVSPFAISFMFIPLSFYNRLLPTCVT